MQRNLLVGPMYQTLEKYKGKINFKDNRIKKLLLSLMMYLQKQYEKAENNLSGTNSYMWNPEGLLSRI